MSDDNSVLPPELTEEEILESIKKRGVTTARPLQKEVIWASLSGLGHNENGHVIYTTAQLSSLTLNNIDALSSYRHLQRIHLDNNQLTSLSALQDLTSLVAVTASHNQLDEKVFRQLRASCHSLEKLDLSFNVITTLNGCAAFQYLTDLVVSNNKLTSISRAQCDGLHSLSNLSLSDNEIAHIDPEAFAKSAIRKLNLSRNAITDARFVGPIQSTLAELNLADNNMMHFDVLTGLSQLISLDLSGNNVYDQSELLFVAKLPALRQLGLIGNPLCSLSHGLQEVLDDDAASDVVAADVAAPKRDNGASSEYIPVVAAPISKERAAPPDIDQPPEVEDDEEHSRLSLEQQYRLMVLWKAPNVCMLDGIAVTPQELTMSKNLRGGADRAHRQEVKTKFLVPASGSAANTLRKLRSGTM